MPADGPGDQDHLIIVGDGPLMGGALDTIRRLKLE